MLRIQDYDYHLPPELVAQYPPDKRDASRLLVVPRGGGEIQHAGFKDLGRWLEPRDLLVLNDTRVFPARLQGHKPSGGRVELLLHHLPVAEEEQVLGEGARGRGPLPPLPDPLPQPPERGLGGEFEGRAIVSPGPPLKGHLPPDR